MQPPRSSVAIFISVALALMMTATPAAAGDDPICASRPGKATPTCTVAAGRVQAETGLADWSLQRMDDERTTDLTIGEAALRFGLNDRSELLVDLTPWERQTERTAVSKRSVSGIGDLSLGYKYRLTGEQTAWQVSLLPVVTFPTSGHRLGSGKVEGALLAPIGVSLGKSTLSLNLTPEVDWLADADGHGHHLGMAQVASLGWQVTDSLNLSGELWRQWDWDPGGTTRQASVDGAVAYLVGPDLQLDSGANLGLNRETPDVELYVGVAKRF